MEAEKQFGRNCGRNTTKIQFVEQDGFWGRKNKTAVIIEMWDIIILEPGKKLRTKQNLSRMGCLKHRSAATIVQND